jgi:hypothetical protein
MQPGNNGILDPAKGIFFIYQTPNVAALAAAANTQQALQFDQDSNFVLQKISYFVDIAGGAQTDSTRVLPLITIQITDSGNSQGFMNAPVPIPALLGDGRLPFVLPQPMVIRPNATLQFAFVNYSAATAYANVRVALIGVKRFLTQQ